MGKYTTKDLKREVDRLNKEYKKTDRTAIKFIFGKTDSGDYYIGTKSNAKMDQGRKDNFWTHAMNPNIDKVVESVRSEGFKYRRKAELKRQHDIAMADIEYERYLEKNNKNKNKSKYIK